MKAVQRKLGPELSGPVQMHSCAQITGRHKRTRKQGLLSKWYWGEWPFLSGVELDFIPDFTINKDSSVLNMG